MKTVLICNGDIRDYSYTKVFTEDADLIICCDGGLRHCEKLGVVPDVIAGDFDSASDEILKKYGELGAEIVGVPIEKDFTDTELGLRLAIERGASEIILLGCIGSRIDHTIANIHQLLLPLGMGVTAKIVNENNIIFLADSEFVLAGMKGRTVSLIPFTEKVEGIVTNGLYYPLKNESLALGTSRGISNICTEDNAKVSFSSGTLIVIVADD